jgi:hypothetical protein
VIRIYTDDLRRIELDAHGEEVEIISMVRRPDGTRTITAASPLDKPRMGVVAAALLVAIGAGAGYFVGPRHPRAEADAVADAAESPRRRAEALPTTPSNLPPLIQRELLEQPSVTPPLAASSSPSGPAAFGLQR